MSSPLRRHRFMNEAASRRCTSSAPTVTGWQRQPSPAGGKAATAPALCGRGLLCRLDLDAAHLLAYQNRSRPGAGIWLHFLCN